VAELRLRSSGDAAAVDLRRGFERVAPRLHRQLLANEVGRLVRGPVAEVEGAEIGIVSHGSSLS
jgi:hypothetical protein